MKRILLSVLCAFAALLDAGATGKLLPNGNIELANKFLKAEITPVKGGRVIKLIDLRNNCEYAGSAWDLGAGGELDWQARRLRGGKSVYSVCFFRRSARAKKAVMTPA